MIRTRALLLVLLTALLAGCAANGAASTSTTSPAAVHAVATIGALADLVGQVGGERTSVQALLPADASPESFQPSPQDVQTVAEADIVFYNGYGLEEWLDRLLQSAASEDQPQIELAQGLTPLKAGGEFAEGNPHFWLDPDHAITYVERIRDALSEFDSPGAEVYARNAQRYIRQIRDLDRELVALVETLPPAQRKIVTNHDAFPYFAQHYGFTVVGNILGSAESEPSAGDLAALIERIRQEQVKAIFAEPQFNQELSETVAAEAGVKVVDTLYSDSLNPSAGINGYLDLMRYNVETIVSALK